MRKKSNISRKSRNLLLFGITLVGLGALATELTIRRSSAALSRENITIENPTNDTSAAKESERLRSGLVQTLGKLPLQFEPNEGRADPRVKFLARGPGYGLFLTSTKAVLQLRSDVREDSTCRTPQRRQPELCRTSGDKQEFVTQTLQMKIVGANSRARAQALDESSSHTNYFIGNDPAKWRTNVSTYGKVEYKAVYPGIDLIYYGNQRQLEYDFRVAPGADPRRIKLSFQGAREIRIDDRGNLIIQTKAGDVRLHKPNLYQEENGQRREVYGSFVVTSRHEIWFRVGDYNKREPLVIDPSISYSTTFGGISNDDANGIAVDSSGNAYLVGTTFSTNFPVVGGFQSTFNGGLDVFVTKVSPTGTLVYSTYLGGTLDDQGRSIAVDSAGAAYITGSTRSTNFPTANPLQAANAGGFTDAFVAKLNPAGSALVYSTYVGGTDAEAGTGIAVDSSGNAYITGFTQSSTFPTKAGSFQTTFGGGTCFTSRPCGDAFVAKLNPAGGAFTYSTFLGGNGNDNLDFFGTSYGAIAVDAGGNAYVTGVTNSTNFPTANPFQSACNACSSFASDAFVSKLNPAGTALVYSTYLGGALTEVGHAIAVDSAGEAFVTGNTASFDFPTTGGAFQTTFKGGFEAFVSKFAANGSSMIYSTYLGGNNDDVANGIAIDSSGNAYIVGTTSSTDFPTFNAIQSKGGGSLFKTTNGGTSWSVMNTGLPPTSYGIAVDPTNPNVVYNANDFGVSKSTDGGITWTPTGYYNIFVVFSVALDPNNSSVIYGGLANGVIKSTDGGLTWTTTTTGFTNAGVANTLVIDPTNTSTVYVATTNGGILKSTNSGGSWTAINTGITSNFINTLVIDKTTPATLYAGNSQGVLKTTNGGAAWTVSSTGLPTSSGRFVDGIAFDPTTSATLYATTASVSSVQGGVFKSTNGGASWTTLLRTDFTMGSIIVDRTNANTIYAASSSNSTLGLSNPLSGVGVLKSTDGGVNWTPSGLTQDFVQGLIFDPTNSATIYAPASGGNDIFVSELNPAGALLVYSTYLGGTGAEQGNAVAVTSDGSAYLAGATASNDFPTQAGPSTIANNNDPGKITPQAAPGAGPSLGGTISNQQPDNAFVNALIFCHEVDLAVTKSVVSYDAAQKRVKFKVTVTNNGPNAAGAGMSDTADPNVRILSITPDTSLWTCSISAPNSASCSTSGLMPVGQTVSFTVNCDISDIASIFQNTAGADLILFKEFCDPKKDNNVAQVVFRIPEPPTITSFTPTSGIAGTTVTITGTNFTGATAVAFDGTNATFTVNSDTQITATVPDVAITGRITVTGPGGTATSLNNFTINPPRADLEVTTLGVETIDEGDIGRFSGTVKNDGPSMATSAQLSLTLPTGFSFLSVTSSQGTCAGANPATCNLGDLDVSQFVTWNASVSIPTGFVARHPLLIDLDGGDTFVASSSGNFTLNGNTVPDTFHLSLDGSSWTDANRVSILNHAPIVSIGFDQQLDLISQPATQSAKEIISSDQTASIPTSVTTFVDAKTHLNDLAITDIATPINNNGSGQLVVGINDGTGSFFDIFQFRGFVTTSSPTDINHGDFNNDGADDLVYVDFNSNLASVLLNDTSNFFSRLSFRETGGFQPVSMVVGDFNDDNNIDVAVCTRGGNPNIGAANQSALTMMLGDGAGRLGPPNPLAQVNNFAISMVGGLTDIDANPTRRKIDFNRDGHADLAVLSSGGGSGQTDHPSITLFLNDAAHPGQFIPQAQPIDLFPDFGNVPPIFISCFDVDADGVADLLVGGNGVVDILRNKTAVGATNVTFAKTKIVLGTIGPGAVSMGDFNLNGIRDLAAFDAGGGLPITASANSLTSDPNSANNVAKVTALVKPPAPLVSQFFPIKQPESIDGWNGASAVSSGAPGSLVGVIGNNFLDPIVRFNGTYAHIVAHTDQQVVAVVPVGATNGPVTITTPGGTVTALSSFNVISSFVQLTATSFSVSESAGKATITVTRTGDTSGPASVDFATSDGTAKQQKDYTLASGTLNFAAGETSKTFTVLVTDNAFVDGNRTVNLALTNAVGTGFGSPTVGTLTITDNDTSPGTTNPIDQARFFVQQHYYDFLSRYPDQGGWDFWTNNIDSCTPKPACTDAQRINTSAAYFLSIEFQQTGYLVERIYKTAYGNASGTSTFGGTHQFPVPVVRFNEFMADTQRIGNGLVVGQNGWEQVLENNKQAFALTFVQRPRFTAAFATTLTPAQFVDALFANAGVTPSTTDRNAAIAEFGSATNTTDVTARARALRDVAENSLLNTAEFNRAFVLMQFFGYLRRNPNDLPDADYTGFDFWLTKLNQFNGNYNAAEMVKAFIVSTEYRERFGP
jgi:hypothetical protein